MKSLPMPYFRIADVERESGLSKDVLRKWEMRYGFPAPWRDSQGDRIYPQEQVDRLCLIKRLLDSGMRPSSVVELSSESLQALVRAQPEVRRDQQQAALIASSLALLRQSDPDALRQRLHNELLCQGVEHFILETLAPLNDVVGEAWAKGELGVHEEHIYTEAVQGLLRHIAGTLNPLTGSPRVLLTTLPGEQHGIGILMVATLFALHGVYCINLGTQTPVADIARAARERVADIVALSFSAHFPQRRIEPALAELRQRLGQDIEIWVSGAGSSRVGTVPGNILCLPGLDLGVAAVNAWRGARQFPAEP